MNTYYILYPDQSKDSIDYNRQMVADAGINTIYLKPAWKQIMDGLEMMGIEEFTERFCNPDDIIVFSEKGEEWGIESFVDMLYDKYKSVKHDY